jgi:lipopolysaccharide biosynthesis glycosyltransferase
MINIFLGYDTKETIAYHICSNSIIRHASKPVSIIPLSLTLFSDYKETHTDGSNDFVYTRFLVPHLMDYNGWAIFLDGDMVVTEDINKLWQLRDDTKAVMVVKHNYKTRQNFKYLGQPNKDYPRKNWSSVVLWNCKHPANQSVTIDFVQTASGAQVHRFSWLTDDLIGELPVEWNWLADEFGVNEDAKLIHYTLGTPCFEEFADSPMCEYWHAESKLAGFSK